MVNCSVRNCRNSSRKTSKSNSEEEVEKRISFFRFPKDLELARIWERKCQRTTKNYTNSYICSKHFKKEHYLRNLQHELLNYSPKCCRKLKLDAIPTENLPEILEEPIQTEFVNIEESIQNGEPPESTEFINAAVPPEIVELPGTSIQNVKSAAHILETNGFQNLETAIKEELVEYDPKWNNAQKNTLETTCPIQPQKYIKEEPVEYWLPEPDGLVKMEESADYVETTETTLQKCNFQVASFKTTSTIKPQTFLRVKPVELITASPFTIPKSATFVDKATITDCVAPNIEKFLKQENTLRLESPQLFKENWALKAEIKELKKKNIELQRECYFLKEENKYIDKIFTATQRRKMRHNSKRVEWSEEDITKALAIYSGGPKAYLTLLKQNYPLPAETTIRCWKTKLGEDKKLDKKKSKLTDHKYNKDERLQ